MSTRTFAIVQARMGSSRFPGKMLARLGGIPLLEWVLRRLCRATRLDGVVLATSCESRDDPLAEYASGLGVAVFRGSESDVLGRFIAAAAEVGAETVVRVCADNPLIDPEEIDRLVDFYFATPCDYACNHLERLGSRYADGFGAEIVSADLLRRIAATSMEARHREHVTAYLWDNAAQFSLRAPLAPASLAYPYLRFDVDTPADLDALATLVAAGEFDLSVSAAQVVRQVLAGELSHWLKQLFPLTRSLSGAGNRATLDDLKGLAPLQIHEVATGTRVFDWTIPQEWRIDDAWIKGRSGTRIVDFQDSNLQVASYSTPVCNSAMSWAELEPHLVRHPALPEAIPYRTLYYKRDWMFCVTAAQYEAMRADGGPFDVCIDSAHFDGALSYGELVLPGRSAREILLSCYICHPSMANDSLSGVLLAAFLARHIGALRDRHWTYRIVFVPETIGAIAYCAGHGDALAKVDMGLVITTAGGPGPFGYKQSWQADHPINALIEEVLEETGTPYRVYPFDIHGSDERQYSSPGLRINMATLCKDRYYEYPEYHSSADDLSFVTGTQLAESFQVYCRLIDRIEARRVYRNTVGGGEAMLSRHGLYPTDGGAQRPELGGRSELDLILWLLFLCDGRLSVTDIAKRLSVPVAALEPLIGRLLEKGLLVDV